MQGDIKTFLFFALSLMVRASCFGQWDYEEKADLHIVFGISAGPAIMLAPFEYSADHPELKQPRGRPAYSYYNAFVGVEFLKNVILFSYGDLPSACGYVINNAKTNFIYQDYNFDAVNRFLSLVYQRKLWPTGRERKHSNRFKRWSLYAGAYVGISKSNNILGFKSYTHTYQSNKVFEFQSKRISGGNEKDYFISFGPVAQIRYSMGRRGRVKLFGQAQLRITPHPIWRYSLSYNMYQTPDSEFKTTEVSSRVINLHLGFGILFDIRIRECIPTRTQ